MLRASSPPGSSKLGEGLGPGQKKKKNNGEKNLEGQQRSDTRTDGRCLSVAQQVPEGLLQLSCAHRKLSLAGVTLRVACHG